MKKESEQKYSSLTDAARRLTFWPRKFGDIWRPSDACPTPEFDVSSGDSSGGSSGGSETECIDSLEGIPLADIPTVTGLIVGDFLLGIKDGCIVKVPVTDCDEEGTGA